MTDSEKTGRSSTAGDLERLRDLLLGADQERLSNLDYRVRDLEARTSDVAEVLPGAMNRVVDDPVTKPEIERPIVDTIRGAIKRDTESFAEALFPVLGPAIRRAVADALKSLVQRINVALENSFTVKGMRWRLEAARSGVPFAQVVLSHTMVYAVQEAFLIQRMSGLVLASVRRDEALALDEDAVSAMLTAIQSFIQDSLGVSRDEPLRSAELGDRTLWVINGPEAVLACIIAGSPPRDVRDELMKILETLHAQFGDRFDDHPEVLDNHPGINALMLQALRDEVDEEARGTGGYRYKLLWIAVAVALVTFLVWSSWHAYRDRQLEARVSAAFSNETGFVLTGIDARRGEIKLSGLRDPMARTPEAVLDGAGLDGAGADLAFRAYQSLDAELVLQRLKSFLGDDDSTVLELEGAHLRVLGTLDSGQIAWLNALPASHPAIESVSLEQMRLPPAEAEQLIRASLQVPETIDIVSDDNAMRLTGEVEPRWFATIASGAEPIGGWNIDVTPLREALDQRFETMRQGLDGQEIRFARAYRIDENSLRRLDVLGRDLSELQEMASALGIDLNVRLQGHADGVGTPEKNQEVAMTRARTVSAELGRRGVNTAGFIMDRAPWISGEDDIERRKVVMIVNRSARP